jgi:hypothetical protein
MQILYLRRRLLPAVARNEESDAEETDIIQLSAGVPFSLLTGSGPPGVGDQSITARAERTEA